MGLLLFAAICNGQIMAPGYCIYPDSDTSFITIKVPMEPFGKLNAISLQKKLKVYDSLGHLKKIKPPDITEFGFRFKEINHHFFAKQFNGNSWYFFEALNLGPGASLFYYFYRTRQGLHEYFIVEKKQALPLQLTNMMRKKKIRSRLKEFFEGDQALIEKADSISLQHRALKKSLESLVNDVNNTNDRTPQ
jgi:hypothetical protein